MLYREPMWLKSDAMPQSASRTRVSVLYREPMWLKSRLRGRKVRDFSRFSALP